MELIQYGIMNSHWFNRYIVIIWKGPFFWRSLRKGFNLINPIFYSMNKKIYKEHEEKALLVNLHLQQNRLFKTINHERFNLSRTTKLKTPN